MRQQDAIVLTTYGRSSGYCVDPVEKKPLNHFLPGSAVLSFGTAGCNLGCRFCQNWDISTSRETDTLADEASPQPIAQAAARLGCRSVAFTNNDPVIFLEYAIDVADACREAGVKAVAVTAGYVCAQPRAEFFGHIDAAHVDLKGFTGEFYRRTCLARLDPVLETLLYLRHETGVWLEITSLLIPGLNDSDSDLDAMTPWVAGQLGPDVPVHFTAFHPDFKMRDRPPTPPATLARTRRIALDNGVRYAYTGNVHEPAGQSTRCHHCGTAAAAERCTRTFAGSRAPPPVVRHGDDDLAACVPLLHAAEALGLAGQRVCPVEDRCELPGLDEPGEGEQLLPLLFVRDQPEPLSDETVDHDRPQDASDGPEHVAG